MARKKGAPCRRGAFLRALRRSGNVKLSCRMAGVDHSTVYLARRRDAGFAGQWAAALEKAREAPPPRSTRSPSPSKLREDFVVRVSKTHGPQLVKASAGRWSGRKEALFLAALRRTGCVRTAADACGLSTTALYNRRKQDEDFAMRWHEAEAEAGERLPGLLTAAAIAALDPTIGESDLPPVSIGEAIHICRMKGFGQGGAKGRAAAPAYRVASNAEVRAALEKRLRVFAARVRIEQEQGRPEDGPA